MIIYPEKITKENIVGVTATSGGTKPEDIEKINKAIERFNKLGYKIVETNNVRKSQKLVSTNAKTRAEELIKLWKRNDIGYIIAAHGGDFLMEILPYLDTEILKKEKPKWIQGYSDTSLLLYYLTTNFNLATIHANNFGSYGDENIHNSLIKSIQVAETREKINQESFNFHESIEWGKEEGEYNLKVEYKILGKEKEIEVSGRIIGGCIDVLRTILGTKYDSTEKFCAQFKEGIIWYFDNYNLEPAELHRTIWQIKEAGWLRNVNAFLIGRTRAKKESDEYTYEDVLKELSEEFKVPIIYDVDIGHVAPQWTIINGSLAKFCYKNGRGWISQELI